MKNIFRNFLQIFEKNTSDGHHQVLQSPGCENITESTKTSSNYNTIYTKTNQMQKTYQWIKGERAGSFVKWDGDITDDGGINFLSFTDGSRVNEELMNEYIIEVPSEEEPFYDVEFATPQPNHVPHVVVKQSQQEKPKESTTVSTGNSLIANLLNDSKKTKTTVNIGIVTDIPSVDLMKVLADSYDNGESQVLEYLAIHLDIEDIRKQIAKQIWLQAFSKRKKIKNETV